MIYHIQKGGHYKSGIKIGLNFRNKVTFKAEFDFSCIYDHGTSDNYDVNKLYGFSTSWSHHKQSARIGWRCINGIDIQILAYSYDQGVRQDPQLLGTVKPGNCFECSIEKRKGSFLFTFNHDDKNKFISVKIKDGWFPLRYMLYPYFGGNMKAPHDMIMDVNEMK